MNKILTKVVTLALGAAMAVGVGVAVGSKKVSEAKAAEEVYYTLESAAGSNSNYNSNCDVSISPKASDASNTAITWNVTGNAQMIPWRIGGKSLSGIDRTVYSKTAMGSSISKIELTIGGGSSITVNSASLVVASNSDFSTLIDTVELDSVVGKTSTISPTSGSGWASGSFYKFVFNVTVSGSSNKFITFDSAKFYYQTSGPTAWTVTYDINGGEGTVPVDSNTYDNDNNSVEILPSSGLKKTGHTFEGWTLNSSGTGTVYVAGDNLEISASTVLYAKWTANSYTLSYNANGGSGTLPESSQYTYGSQATVADGSGLEKTGFVFGGWNTSADGSGTKYGAGSKVTIQDDTILYALWSEPLGTFTLVESESDLSDGDKIIIVSEGQGSKKALSTTQNTNNRGAVDVTVSGGDEVEVVDGVQVITLETSSNNASYWNFAVDDGYLYAASSSSNWLRTEETPDANADWEVTISNKIASITAKGNYTHNQLKNNGSLFSCYASGQTSVSIYKSGSVTPTTTYAVNDNIVNGSLNKNSVKEGATLVVTISPEEGYVVPENVSVEEDGVAREDFTYSEGVVTIENVQGDITISGECGVAPAEKGTESNPYTVAEALAASPASGKYVTGIISQIDDVSTSYGNATYWISDDGTTTGQMKVYRGKYLDNASFTSASQIAVGDTCVITGTISAYQSVNQMAQGNYLTYLDHHEIVVEPITTIQGIYEGAAGDPVDLYGYYVGFLDGTGPVIMDGEYGVVIFNKTASVSGYTEKETILHLTGTVSIYKGLYEVTPDTLEVASGTFDEPATPVVYSSTGDETASYASRLTTVTGTPTLVEGSFDSAAGTADIKMSFAVGTKTIQVFYKMAAQTADAEAFAAIKDAVANSKEITIKGFTGWYNGFQVQMNGYVPAADNYTAEDFSQDLLDQTDAICVNYVDGESSYSEFKTALEAVWSDLASDDKYPALPTEEKNALAEADRVEDGTVIEQAMARYDFLTGKYKLSNFINGRTPIASNGSLVFETSSIDSSSSITIIVVVAVASMTLLGVTLVLRKRKHQ